jgi:uncharacterized membrane protein
MTYYFAVKYLHIIGASVLFGTGAGIAFFMLVAHRSRNVAVIAGVARIVVLADFLFTATAVVLQPLSGIALARLDGYPLLSGWLPVSIALYVFVGIFWLPVVWMQMRMQTLAEQAVRLGAPLPQGYYKLFRVWLLFGFPAFAAVLVIFWLMITRPSF